MKIRFLFAKKRQDKKKITYKRFPFFFFFDRAVGLVGSKFPDQGLNPGLAMKALSPNHWTARAFPKILIF